MVGRRKNYDGEGFFPSPQKFPSHSGWSNKKELFRFPTTSPAADSHKREKGGADVVDSLIRGEGERSSTMAEEAATVARPSEEKEREREGELEEGEIAEDGGAEQAEARGIGVGEARTHPLEHSWTFLFDNPSAKSKQAAWGSSIRPVHTFTTVEDFWRIIGTTTSWSSHGAPHGQVHAQVLPPGQCQHRCHLGHVPGRHAHHHRPQAASVRAQEAQDHRGQGR